MVVAAAAVISSIGGRAWAAARPYGFVDEAETLPQDNLELESWFSAQKPASGGPSAWDWWMGPVAGLTDHLEGGLFAIFGQPGAAKPTLALSSLRLQLTYALADKGAWPVDVAIRAEGGLPVDRTGGTAWLWLFLSRDWGRVNGAVNLGSWLSFAPQSVSTYIDANAGASVALPYGARIGGEFYFERNITRDRNSIFAGPSLAYGRGRFWASATFGWGIGPKVPEQHGRIILGLLF